MGYRLYMELLKRYAFSLPSLVNGPNYRKYVSFSYFKSFSCILFSLIHKNNFFLLLGALTVTVFSFYLDYHIILLQLISCYYLLFSFCYYPLCHFLYFYYLCFGAALDYFSLEPRVYMGKVSSLVLLSSTI